MPVFDGLMPGSRGRGGWLRSLERIDRERSDAGPTRRVGFAGDAERRDRELLLKMAAELEEIHRAMDSGTPSSSGRSIPVVPVGTGQPVPVGPAGLVGSPVPTLVPTAVGLPTPVPMAEPASSVGAAAESSATEQRGDFADAPCTQEERFMATDYGHFVIKRSMLPTLKPVQFDGSKPWETFLAKFDNCSDYYGWSERERVYHLRASLDSEAAHVLCDLDKRASSEDVIQLLKKRFGNQDQRERFRAELKAIFRTDGSTLQSV